jgi:hypothetical protein
VLVNVEEREIDTDCVGETVPVWVADEVWDCVELIVFEGVDTGLFEEEEVAVCV